MANIVFEHVTKRYADGVEAVTDMNLAIADGEFMILVGPSGSGKSTALRMLAGLEDITEGVIRIGDDIVNDLAPRDRDIAMVFQNYALYPHMTVRENMGFALKLARTPRKEIARKVEEAARVLDIERQLDRKPANLSGGQRQRVAMGRAIVRDPKAFLMDEPLSNLDAKLRVQTRTALSRLHERLGTTTIYVTHDQVEALTLGDRVAVMNDGRLEQVGTPEELYDEPANVFVGGFIGSPPMSFLRRDGALLGVRPEHVRPWADGLLGPIDGRVAYVEALGRETLVGVETGDGATLVTVLEGRARLEVGEPLRVGLVESGVRRFDAT